MRVHESIVLGKIILYQKRRYDEFEKFLNGIDWESEFLNMNAYECYNKWLSIYKKTL